MHISKKKNASKYENKDVTVLENVANLAMASPVNPSDKAKLIKARDGKSMRNLASLFDCVKNTIRYQEKEKCLSRFLKPKQKLRKMVVNLL